MGVGRVLRWLREMALAERVPLPPLTRKHRRPLQRSSSAQVESSPALDMPVIMRVLATCSHAHRAARVRASERSQAANCGRGCAAAHAGQSRELLQRELRTSTGIVMARFTVAAR